MTKRDRVEEARLAALRRPGAKGYYGINGVAASLFLRAAAVGSQPATCDADDLVQDVELELFIAERAGTIDPDLSKLTSFAGHIARAKLWRYRRSGHGGSRAFDPTLRAGKVPDEGVIDPDEKGPEAEAVSAEIRRGFEALLQRLDRLGRSFDKAVLQAVIDAEGVRVKAAADLSFKYKSKISLASVKEAMRRIKSSPEAKALLGLYAESVGEDE